jgi:hypothetical protein
LVTVPDAGLVSDLAPAVTVGAAVVAAAAPAAGVDFTASAASAGAASMVVAINATANLRIMGIVLWTGPLKRGRASTIGPMPILPRLCAMGAEPAVKRDDTGRSSG